MIELWSGYRLGLSLIVAIGAQNAFVLRQGLRREHVLAVIMICACSDAFLIAVGVAGFDALTALLPGVVGAMRWGGAAFLIYYGLRSLWSAWQGAETLLAAENGRQSLRAAVTTCLALTWLNPHVYLDTVVLLGSISASYDHKLLFAMGAISASFSFFFMLGFGARLLAPLFARPLTWRILDLGIAALMFSIAFALIRGG